MADLWRSPPGCLWVQPLKAASTHWAEPLTAHAFCSRHGVHAVQCSPVSQVTRWGCARYSWKSSEPRCVRLLLFFLFLLVFPCFHRCHLTPIYNPFFYGSSILYTPIERRPHCGRRSKGPLSSISSSSPSPFSLDASSIFLPFFSYALGFLGPRDFGQRLLLRHLCLLPILLLRPR